MLADILLYRRRTKHRRTDRRITFAVADRVQKGLSRLAGWLQRRTDRLSRKALRGGLFFFCLMAGGSSLYVAWGDHSSHGLSVTSIKRPRIAPFEATLPTDSLIREGIHRRIMQFKNDMDRLKQAPQGKIRYDRIMAERPGLMDSIAHFDHLYHLSTQK